MEDRPLSDCCKVKIIPGGNSESYADRCSKCNQPIAYALMDLKWASREACGVFKDYNNDQWFFWHQVSQWDMVQELTSYGQTYLGQIKALIATLGCRYHKDPDTIPPSTQKKFLKEFETRVRNPEIVSNYIR